MDLIVWMFLPHLRMETDAVFEVLCSLVFLEYRMTDTVQQPSNFELHQSLNI
jgi:hypothetical protein